MLSNSSAPRKNVHIYRDGSLTEETGVRRITFPENHEGAEIEAVTSPEISKPRLFLTTSNTLLSS
ncbi:hypothetical protein YC2023_097615 [Brassica napus]